MNDERIEVANNLDDDTNVDYISALNEMKANTVSKDSYMKLKAENKKLLDALVEGKQIASEDVATVNPDQLRKDLYGDKDKSMDPLEYVTKTLQLRQSIIDAGKDDPAVPSGHMYSPTSVDKESAQKVADILQECVDIADGNTGVFMSELQRVIKDTPLIRRK